MKKITKVEANNSTNEINEIEIDKAEDKQQEPKENKPKRTKLIVMLSLAAVVIAAAAVLYAVFKSDISYAIADAKLDNGNNAEARQIFAELGDFEDAGERVLQIDYATACKVMDSGDYTAAIPMFEILQNYSDCPGKITQCYTLIAEGLFDSCDYKNARINFETAGCTDGVKKTDTAWGDELYANGEFDSALAKWLPYAGESDIDKRIADADYEITITAANEGDFDAVIKANNLNFDERAAETAEALLMMPKESTVPLAASETHIAYIDSDGKVYADGSNSHGQCDVEDWYGVVSLCVSELNTYGLRYDGTVVAAGSNAFGQCDVSSWKNIVSVCATDNAVFGLTADGKVIYTGGVEGWYDAAAEWTNILEIAAGMEHIVALDSSGNIFAAGKNHYEQLEVSEETGIANITCGPMSTILIKTDGSVKIIGVCDALKEGETITDAASVSSSWSHIVVMHTDGSMSAYGAGERSQCAVSEWQDILVFTARGTFTVGVKNDGSVLNTVNGHTLDWQVLVWK